MRTFNLKMSSWALFAIALFGTAVLTGCKDDDDDPIIGGGTETPVEDGFYITGTATGYSSPSNNASFSTARNEVFNADYNSGALAENARPALQEAYVAVQSSGDFMISQVSGSTTTSWGFGSDVEVIAGGTQADGPSADFWRGSLVEGGSAISVDTDGIYHIAFDTEAGKMVVVPVETWGLIGAATPLGWSTSTPMTPGAFTTTGAISYTATDVAMTVADWKFRSTNGWKVVLDADFDNGSATPGIVVNTNFGGAVNALVAGGDNMSNTESGLYSAAMTYTPGSGWTASMTKTANLPAFDYSATELGLIGAGLNFMGAAHNWDETIYVQTPAVAGEVYTWTYNDVSVNVAGGGFKIREGQTWDDLSFGYTAVDVVGAASADFETNGDGNFIPLVDGGTYNITFVIDAANDTRTFTVDPA